MPAESITYLLGSAIGIYLLMFSPGLFTAWLWLHTRWCKDNRESQRDQTWSTWDLAFGLLILIVIGFAYVVASIICGSGAESYSIIELSSVMGIFIIGALMSLIPGVLLTWFYRHTRWCEKNREAQQGSSWSKWDITFIILILIITIAAFLGSGLTFIYLM